MMSVLSSSPRSKAPSANRFTEPFPVSLDPGAMPDENCLFSGLHLREPGKYRPSRFHLVLDAKHVTPFSGPHPRGSAKLPHDARGSSTAAFLSSSCS